MNPQDILAQVMGTRSGKKMSPSNYPPNHPLDPATPTMPKQQVDQLQQLMMQMGVGGHGGDGDFIEADQVRQAGNDVAGIEMSPPGDGASPEQLVQLILQGQSQGKEINGQYEPSERELAIDDLGLMEMAKEALISENGAEPSQAEVLEMANWIMDQTGGDPKAIQQFMSQR